MDLVAADLRGPLASAPDGSPGYVYFHVRAGTPIGFLFWLLHEYFLVGVFTESGEVICEDVATPGFREIRVSER